MIRCGIGCGDLERCRRIKPDVVEFSGWAYLAPQKRPATNVILVWRDSGGDDHPFALSGIQPGRRDIASMLGKPDGFPCAFTGTARLPHSRPGRVVVSAWTVDTDERVAYTLEGKHAVRAGQPWKDTEGEAAPKKEGE
ncbi:MAG: hypothetical protein MUE60_05330 [Candidatus Eisenbacteria bacterium]|nr:hypothetical protein [Candidatus Eisenbacteria bacterium]